MRDPNATGLLTHLLKTGRHWRHAERESRPWLVGRRKARTRAHAAAAMDAAERSLEELGERLVGLIGREGYRALVTRALQLASAEHPVLSEVLTASHPPGRLIGLQGSPRIRSDELRNAVNATLTQLVRLLDQFIGPDLAVHIARDVSPRFTRPETTHNEPRRLTG